MSGIDDIYAERRRQVSAEGFSFDHDDEHVHGELSDAALMYEYWGLPDGPALQPDGTPGIWPWAPEWWKPKGRRENLIRAGALLQAELERVSRRGVGHEEYSVLLRRRLKAVVFAVDCIDVALSEP